MENFPELKAIVDSFTSSSDLEQFAEFIGILNEPYVKKKLLEVKWNELEKELDLPPIDPDVLRQIMEEQRPRTRHYGGQQPFNQQAGASHQSQKPVQAGPSNRPFSLRKVGEKKFKTRTAVDTKYSVSLDSNYWNDKKLRDIHTDLHEMFSNVLDEAKENTTDTDSGRVLIHHPSLDNAIVVPLRPVGELNADIVMQTIENVLTSHQELSITDDFGIDVGIITDETGTGRVKITDISGPNNSVMRKSSIIQIVNEDTLCMARAIAVCWARQHKISNKEWRELTCKDPQAPILQQVLNQRKLPDWYYRNILNTNRREQKQFAFTISDMAGVPLDRAMGLNDIQAFEDLLDVNILVVSARLGNKFIKVASNTNRKNLYLYLVENGDNQHFHAIGNIGAFFSSVYFCKDCLKAYNNKEKHSCDTKCIVCKNDNCLETDTKMSCIKCHMTCRSMSCFTSHQLPTYNSKSQEKAGVHGPSQCEKWWKCTTCFKVLNTNKRKPSEHQCGEYRCSSCLQYVFCNHQCYVRATPAIEETIPKFIFFDVETTQDQIAQCESGYNPVQTPDCQKCGQDKCSDCLRCKNCFNSWCGRNEHRPNFIVAQTVCPYCIDTELNPASKCKHCGSRCETCGDVNYKGPPCMVTCGFREKVFSGDTALHNFGQWIFTEHHKYFTVMAHNGKGYDFFFLLEYLINQSMRPEKIIYNGSKIMYMQIGRGLCMKVIDSLNFLPMKLAALPKAFGLSEAKGWFPHFFNLRQNQNYVGPYPDPQYYGANRMDKEERKQFLEWHDTKNGETFDFREQMLRYCRSDVDILRQACLKFREILMNATGKPVTFTDENGRLKTLCKGAIDPFDYVTIASVCMGVYRTKFLEEKWRVKVREGDQVSDWMDAKMVDGKLSVFYNGDWTDCTSDMDIQTKEFVSSPIAQVPTDRHGHKDQYSKVSIQWLEWIMHSENIHIQHALNGGEKSLVGTRYKLDGFCVKNNTAYEFLGCMYHGCPSCYPRDRDSAKHPRTKQSMEELYALTMKKKSFIEKSGFTYVCIWEHEFTEKIKSCTELREYVKTLDIVDRLEPRDSFFGGRTGCSTLHWRVTQAEKIRYVDFTSLYPYVNKYCRYPVGHPRVIISDFGDISDYFGIAQVAVLPPRGLYHPVLPYRSNGKLKFPLCRTCADKESQTPCTCSEKDRVITGTWCTPELQKALQKGYKILKIYEIYHWDETTKYDAKTGEGGLFAKYINTFLKFKQEASDWPNWVKTHSDSKQYIERYFEKEGVKLDWNKIKKNPGLRALAKLCLNSFWGKFGQRLNMKQTEFIHESQAEKFFQMLSDLSKDIQNFHIISDQMIQLEWKSVDNFVPCDTKTNIYLACFTTCWARLKLYGVLEQVNERVLYYDTDSIIYVSEPGKYDPPLGDYLGELTNELDGDDYIIELVAPGPKNYAFRTNSGKETCKVRGFTLNFTNSQIINFEAVKDIVTKPDNKSVAVINPSKICRDKLKRKLYNRKEQKKYQMVYTKRVLLPNFDTVPYGY